MQKITEIQETKFRTTYQRDILGNRVAKKIPFAGCRKVTVVSGGRRFAHYFVDNTAYYILFVLIEFLVSFILVLFKNDALTIIAIEASLFPLFFLSWPIFYIFFEYKFQRTPGKFLTQCIVIDIYGNKPSIGTLILRNIIRMVPFEIFSCMSERGWHDRWSDTFVVPMNEYKELRTILDNKEKNK